MGLRNVAKHGGLRSTKTFIIIYTYYVGSHMLFYQKHVNVSEVGERQTGPTCQENTHRFVCFLISWFANFTKK